MGYLHDFVHPGGLTIQVDRDDCLSAGCNRWWQQGGVQGVTFRVNVYQHDVSPYPGDGLGRSDERIRRRNDLITWPYFISAKGQVERVGAIPDTNCMLDPEIRGKGLL